MIISKIKSIKISPPKSMLALYTASKEKATVFTKFVKVFAKNVKKCRKISKIQIKIKMEYQLKN